MVSAPYPDVQRSPLQFLAHALPAWLRRQVTAPSSANCGAWISPDTELPNSGHVGTAALLTGCVWLALWGSPANRAMHWRRALLATRHLRSAQHRSGLIDLPDCNWDSAPDTAFVVQLLCAVLERIAESATPAPAELQNEIRAFLHRAVPGLAHGGFHTPNHRWVIASALAWIATLTGDRRGDHALHAYLAEGIDQDTDGAYQERSPAVYDAVTNRSLLLLARHATWKSAPRAVTRNLSLARMLLNADGTIESLQSRRQDRMWRLAPTSLAAIAWQTGDHPLAAWLWERSERPSLNDAIWLLFAQTEHALAPASLPATKGDPASWRGARRLTELGVARARADEWTASAFVARPELLRLSAPGLGLRAVSVALPYFGVGQCFTRRVQAHGTSLRLILGGTPHPRRPGYELPLGRPVPIEAWDALLEQRPLRRLPAIRGDLSVRLGRSGATLTLRTRGALAGIPVQLALDFSPGLELRSAGRWRRARAGEVYFLGAGESWLLRRDAVTWSLGPGASAHRVRRMRDAWAPTDTVRVIVALRQPATHTLRLRQL